MVLFWLDLWEIFFLATLEFEPGTSGSLVLHSTTAPRWLLVFTSDNFRYLTLVQRDWWWYCPDWTCERFSFCPHHGMNSVPLDLESCTLPLCSWWFLVFTSNNFRYLTLVQRDWWWYCSDWTYERFCFWPHQGLNLGTSGSLVLQSTTVTTVTSGFHLWQFQVFNSGAEGLVVVLFWLDLWEIFFLATPGFEPWDFWISSHALYHCTMGTSGFHFWQFEVFNSGVEGLVVVLFWLDLWEILFLATPGVWTHGTSGSLVLHSTTAPRWLLVFTAKNFRYLTLVQRDWWWYCSDWTCERFSFWPHQGWTPGSLDL